MTDLATLPVAGGSVTLRTAVRADVPAVVALLADDELGRTRETPPDGDLSPYLRAFDLLDGDPGELLVVAVLDGEVVGTLQLSVIPGLSRGGALRAQLEAVRVASRQRGTGLGTALVGWAIEEARRQGCALVQLTSDKRRPDAHRFYGRLGFRTSHEGLKLDLRSPGVSR
jgi:GNAT superfamily N-acetyltransferase